MSVGAEKSLDLMTILGGLILVCVILFFVFKAINRSGMAEQRGTATVIKKDFLAQRQDHLPNGIINVEPDRYQLRLRVEDKEGEFNASKDIYDSVRPNDKVQVTYKRLRATNGIAITEVTR
jgi:hypothetical protein